MLRKLKGEEAGGSPAETAALLERVIRAGAEMRRMDPPELAFELLIHNFSWLHPFATGAPDRARGHAGHGAARRNVFQHHRASRNPRIKCALSSSNLF